MNTTIYAARAFSAAHELAVSRNFDNYLEARLAVEAQAEGNLIEFIRMPNIPNRSPAYVYRSVSMSVWSNGEWKDVYIH